MNLSESWQIALILDLQHWPAWWLTFMGLMTELGRTEAYLLFITTCFWCFDSRLGLRLGLLLPTVGLANDILKFMFHHPRPFWVDTRVAALTHETAFGMPSGHSMSAAAMWIGLAAGRCCWWLWLVAGAMILLIGASRSFMGVHFPLQILTGWSLGLILVIIWLKLESRVARWLIAAGLRVQILVSLAAGAAAVSLSWVAKIINSGWRLPETWAANAAASQPVANIIEPFNRHGALFMAGVLTGVGLGAALMHHRGWFTETWSWPNRLIRFLIGATGTVALVVASKMIGRLLAEVWLADYAWRMAAGGLIGLWVAWIAPLLFIRLKLAARLS